MSPTRVRVVTRIECPATVAWRAAHSPAAAADVYRPLLHMRALDGELPERFESGDTVTVQLRVLGIVPVGRQLIMIDDVSQPKLPANARTMRDHGRPLSGPLALSRGWNHEISIWPEGDTGAVWHDELTLTGPWAPVLALVLRPMWWCRGARIRRLARAWAEPNSAGHSHAHAQSTPHPERERHDRTP